MKNAAFDRVTGCETTESSERQARVRDASPWPWVYLEAWDRKYRVLASSLWDDPAPTVWRIDAEGVEHRVPEVRRAAVVEKLRAREADERRDLENEQTDSRAIDWLRKRGRLVKGDDGREYLA